VEDGSLRLRNARPVDDTPSSSQVRDIVSAKGCGARLGRFQLDEVWLASSAKLDYGELRFHCIWPSASEDWIRERLSPSKQIEIEAAP